MEASASAGQSYLSLSIIRECRQEGHSEIIHASLSKNYVLELVIGKGALRDTFL